MRLLRTMLAVLAVAIVLVAAHAGERTVTLKVSGMSCMSCPYQVQSALKRVIAGRGGVLICGTCMDARGMTDEEVIEGARRSTMDELAEATATADKLLVF